MNEKEKDAQSRLEKMGLGKAEVKILLGYKEGEDYLYDSCFKITALSQRDFTEKVKDQLKVRLAAEVYQKAIYRKEFISRYIANNKSASEPYYKALSCSKKVS
ncbi:MAG: hypothetical protein QWI36_05000 [Wolbachia endosymbiont of Tyrophagus putrescentiae]|nr:hypothetical protein [Wolbachia endosymbiont of Tyrophagus putrescentiae]